MNLTKTNIILKLSGAALKDSKNDSILSATKLLNLADQIKTISTKNNIGIIIGGGNIWRGGSADIQLYDRAQADYMGMLATVINSLALKEVLLKNKIPAKVYSLIDMPKIAAIYNLDHVKKDLNKGVVCIFSCGTGNPFFSTDTAAAVRAAELNSKFILVGKDGVDGVYSDDPKKNKNAKRFEHLTYDKIINMNLKVMDITALTFCKENNLELVVFNSNEPNGIIKAIERKINVTTISNK